jgi:hypothetical protein
MRMSQQNPNRVDSSIYVLLLVVLEFLYLLVKFQQFFLLKLSFFVKINNYFIVVRFVSRKR